jgi:acetyl-CoA C-acetyltransferase
MRTHTTNPLALALALASPRLASPPFLYRSDYGITREDQDAFAIESYRRASEAVAAGKFAKEIAPYTVSSRRGDTVVDTDVEPSATNPDKIPKLRSAFKKEGTVTAANASSLNDGACTMIMMDEEEAKAMGLKPVARVLGFADAEQVSTTITGVRRGRSFFSLSSPPPPTRP